LSSDVFEPFALYPVRHPEQLPAPEAAIERVFKDLARAGK
jgi:hypothetical protein